MRPVKRLLIFVMAVVAGASTYDYAQSPGPHNSLVVLGGVILALLLVAKAIG